MSGLDELLAMFAPTTRRSCDVRDIARWADAWTPRPTSGRPGVDGWLATGDDAGGRWARRRGFLIENDDDR